MFSIIDPKTWSAKLPDTPIAAVKDLPFRDYVAMKAINKSSLDNYIKAPVVFKAAFDGFLPRIETDAMRNGRAFHTMMLEPEKFDEEFATAPEFDRRTKLGKEEYAEWAALNSQKTILKPEDYDNLCSMRNSLSKSIIEHIGVDISKNINELSLFWQDPLTNMLCKGRMDSFDPKSGVVFDVKTSKDVSPRIFSRSIADRFYHVQAAMYHAGLEALGYSGVKQFVFLCVEPNPPFLTAIYHLDHEAIAAGRARLDWTLMQLKKSFETDNWPGYGRAMITIPRWEMDEVSSLISQGNFNDEAKENVSRLLGG